MTAVLLSAVVTSGCMEGQKIILGPIPLIIPVGTGIIDAVSIGLPPGIPSTVETEFPFCEVLTEDDILAVLEQILGPTLAPIFEVTEIELTGARMTALQGDLSGLTDLRAYYMPVAEPGMEPELVLLSSATSETGFGQSIQLEPAAEIDLLDLIRENENTSGEGCPSILVELSGLVPEEFIVLEAEIQVDVYGTATF